MVTFSSYSSNACHDFSGVTERLQHTGMHHLLTHVILVRVACGSKLTPAPYEKAQTSEEMIYMQAVRSSSMWFLYTGMHTYMQTNMQRLSRFAKGGRAAPTYMQSSPHFMYLHQKAYTPAICNGMPYTPMCLGRRPMTALTSCTVSSG